MHAHRFRHTFAIRWLSAGGGEMALQELAGWSSGTMLRRYTAARRRELAVAEYERVYG